MNREKCVKKTNNMRTLTLLIIVLLLSGCGGIQKARFYSPIDSTQTLPSKEWGDGLAVVNRDVCVWVGDRTALYLPMAAGPIGLPVFPLGVMAGKIDRLGILDLGVGIVPRDDFKFDPAATFLEFENGITKQPQVVLKVPSTGYKALTEPIDVSFWSTFIMRFEKPDKDIGPRKLRFEGIVSTAGEKRIFEFEFKEITKYRYLVSGQHPNAEWGAYEVSACEELLGASKALETRNDGANPKP
jgi:uncharacterized protein YceK